MKRIVCVLLVLASVAHAETDDPTRPPASWLSPGSDGGQAGDAVAGGGLRLQSVLLPQGGRPVAVIGGRTVPLGGQVGGARLVRLSEREAVLQGPEGTTRLYLTPGVEKQMLDSPAPQRGGKAKSLKGTP